jgi:hypothetical protein
MVFEIHFFENGIHFSRFLDFGFLDFRHTPLSILLKIKAI